MTQVGRYAIAHPPKRLDESSRLAPFARLYLHPVATCCEKLIVTSFELS